MIVIAQADAYEMAYVSLWRNIVPPSPPAAAPWKHVPRFGAASKTRLAEQAWYSKALEPYRRLPCSRRRTAWTAPRTASACGSTTCVAVAGRSMPFRYGACRNGVDAVRRVYHLFNDADGREVSGAIAR